MDNLGVITENEFVMTAKYICNFLEGTQEGMVIKIRRVMAIFIFIVYIALHTYLIAQMVRPFSGVTISIDQHQNFIVEHINKNGWVNNTDIKKGDIIKKIDGKELKGTGVQNTLKYADDLTVEHNDKVIRFMAPDKKVSDFLQELYIPGVFSILTLLLSVLIFQKKNATANFMLGFMMLASLSFLSSNATHRDFVADLILIFSFQLGALSFFCFVYSTFLEKGFIQKKPKVMLTINIILAILIILLNLYSLIIKELSGLFTDNLMLIYFSFNIVYSIGLLIYIYIKKRDSLHEPFLKWMLVIPTVAFVPFIFFMPFLI
ncbi:hypothetical protein [Bacillus xiapuensis]|uniref:hypothetical protein n=1 Tax=Bacillus xiapuensis TaxID=2014075 RepID=UPI000C249503|nr:hypothetical protein [Bacillus xiapuensis]